MTTPGRITEEDHVLVLNDKTDIHEDGLVLGNGDLSVSIYQRNAEIIWRFGKNDVWDRRHMTDDDPEPLTIDELRRGIRDEGWCSEPMGGKVTALRGAKDPKRTWEVLQHSPSRYYPYPMAKPVGELSLRWPADLQGLKITQKLFVKQGRVEIHCQWQEGEQLEVGCFVHPVHNVLVVDWNLSNFDSGPPQAFFKTIPVWLSLYRWADPHCRIFAAQRKAKYNFAGFDGLSEEGVTLPPPEVLDHQGQPVIQQQFYPDNIYPEGFRYWLGCVTDQPGVSQVDTGVLNEANILITSEPPMDLEELCNAWPARDRLIRECKVEYPPMRDYGGYIVVPVTTSSDEGGCEQAYNRICDLLRDKPQAVLKTWKEDTIRAAQEFWSASGIRVAEKTLENLWYENMHVCRCIYRPDTVSPGEFLPCYLNDYSQWNGDYHMNYNFQQCFWGFFTANHVELTEAYLSTLQYFEHIGKKIAKEYFGTRGTFIQIGCVPMLLDDDFFPTSPMGRMPYMTGWAVTIPWMYYLYTRDMDFLRDRAYPFIRDCALFYTDFLELGDDGLYHAFPSSYGECGYDGNPETNTDAPQTMIHTLKCLEVAVKAAQLLGIDADLQNQWQERIDKLAPGKGESEWEPLPEAFEPRHLEHNMPEFRPAEWFRFPRRYPFAKRWWNWVQFLPWGWLRDVRGGQFDLEKDFDDLIRVIKRWRHKNGLLWNMPTRLWGRIGPMTETFGIIAGFQEMLLQSWDGHIHVFPVWPKKTDCEFETLRAEGAFLVSARQENGQIGPVLIESLAGERVSLINPWPQSKARITQEDNSQVILEDASATLAFDTKKGNRYRVEPAEM